MKKEFFNGSLEELKQVRDKTRKELHDANTTESKNLIREKLRNLNHAILLKTLSTN